MSVADDDNVHFAKHRIRYQTRTNVKKANAGDWKKRINNGKEALVHTKQKTRHMKSHLSTTSNYKYREKRPPLRFVLLVGLFVVDHTNAISTTNRMVKSE